MKSKHHQRYFNLAWHFISWTLVFLSPLFPVQAEVDLPAEVLSNIEQSGQARVIVTLKMPTQSTRIAERNVKSWRAQINQQQEQLKDELYLPSDENVSSIAAQKVKHQFWSVPLMALEVSSETLSKLQKHPLVDKIEADEISRHTLLQSIPLIEANTVWNQGYSGTNQTVAILDTGIDQTHSDLAGKVIAEACYSSSYAAYSATTVCPNGLEVQIGSGAGNACDNNISGCNHGTHIAGIVAANGTVKGVAKDANLAAIQVFSRFDSSTYCGSSTPPCALSFKSDQIAGLEYVLELHESGTTITAVNMSLGTGKYSNVCDGGAMQTIIDELRSLEIAVIVASGNSGYTNAIASPACIASAISVGATTDYDLVPYYSNSADFLDLLAPGSSIVSTVPVGNIGSKSGTSMAAPHVAGAFAVLKSIFSTASVDDILISLKETGKPIIDTRNDIIKPRINLRKALEHPALLNPASCQLYAVHDQGLNNSQFFTINLDNHTVSPLGSMYPGYDIEAIAIHPSTNIIYAASGDDVGMGKEKGYLYMVDGQNGQLVDVGSTHFNEIEDMAFTADGALWAWAKGDGLITIDITNGQGNLEIPSDVLVEGLALKEDQGTIFYGAVNADLELWEYNHTTSHLEICTNLPGQTEALEIMSDGLLLFGIHNDNSFSLHAFNPDTCEVIIDKDIPTGPFNDVEGIALPIGACNP